jgi:hypothetical protein
MGNIQLTAFQTALKKFATNNFFLERSIFLERTFIEALRRLFGHYRANKSNYAKTWHLAVEQSIDQIYEKHDQVEELLALLSSESCLRKLNENELFRLVMEKCHGDPTFSDSCWYYKTSNCSQRNVETFFRVFSDLLQETFLDLFDNSVMRPELLNLEEFHRHFDLRLEIEGNREYNSNYQKSMLVQMLKTTIELTMIQYHYRNENEMKTPSYLTASNGTIVYVSNLFVRDLDKHWVNLLLICGSNAESQTLTHEALVKWRTTGKRIE